MNLLRILPVLCLCALPLRAQLVETYTFDTFGGNPTLAVPDGNATGVSDTRTVTSSIPLIEAIRVFLDLPMEYNGDVYVYLRHDTGFSVLLNRPGRTSANSFGYADSGFNVSLSDAAANDIHNYSDLITPGPGLSLTQEWKPDGRNVDPSLVLNTTSRTANLDSFNGLNANGTWTLFVADVQTGGLTQIDSWGLEITAVPEPQQFAVLAGACLLLFAAVRTGLGRRSACSGKVRHS
jgi:subtilisin-like proprotein convertase family protein